MTKLRNIHLDLTPAQYGRIVRCLRDAASEGRRKAARYEDRYLASFAIKEADGFEDVLDELDMQKGLQEWTEAERQKELAEKAAR